MSSYSTVDSSESEDNSDHASMASQATTGPRQKRPQAPQDIIDEFWSKFTSKTPGRGTSSAMPPVPILCTMLGALHLVCQHGG